MQGALVLANGTAGRGHNRRKLERVRRLCAEAGVPLVYTGSPRETLERARQAALEGCDRVIAAGGDGTAHYVLNGVAGSDAALGIIPLGSGNDLAHNLGLPCDVEAATRVALTGRPRRADLGRVQLGNQGVSSSLQPPASSLYFGCIASFGLDSHANRLANRHTRLHGKLIYIYALLRSLIEYRVPRIAIRGGGAEFSGPMMLVAAANAPSYGGGMRIAPHADMTDGRLDLCIVRDMSRLKLLRCFPEVFFGTHLRHPEITCVRTSGFRLEADRQLEIFADGEFVGLTPAEVEVLPGALKFISDK